ncbi:hypothetical protein P8452_64613 [Trifolium repens]|nr:hypothetical protein P8452_64613 [Trifolium repens]
MDPTNQLQLVVYVPQEVCPQELSSTTSIVLGVPPLSAYEIDLLKPFVKDLELQINIYKQELKELEEPKDPEHMFAMIAFEDVANKVEKKRGRKAQSKVIGPISVSFELPHQYFSNDEIQRVLATRQPFKFSAFERTMNWKMHLTKRVDDRRYDVVRLNFN